MTAYVHKSWFIYINSTVIFHTLQIKLTIQSTGCHFGPSELCKKFTSHLIRISWGTQTPQPLK